MQDIFFKAKRIDKNEWEHGYIVKINEDFYIVPYYASTFYGIKINPNTACQYTRLNDKDNTMIFTGDICEHNNQEYVVFWNDLLCGLCIWDRETGDIESFDRFFTDRCKVVGNVYDEED